MQAAGDTSRANAERPSRRRGKGSRRAAKQATWRRTAWELIRDTTNTCVEYRVTGLAAEAAFFTLLSIPPLLLGLAGTLGYLDEFVGAGTIAGLKKSILSASGTVLSDSSVNEVVVPLLDGVFDRTRPDLVSIGFLLSLWSGSRALYIFIDTITVMYGLDGKRGIVKTRLMSLSLYFGALVIGSLVLPLLMVGPGLLENAVPGVSGLVGALYWPVAIVLLTVSLTTLSTWPSRSRPRGARTSPAPWSPWWCWSSAASACGSTWSARSRAPRCTARWRRRWPSCCGSSWWRSRCSSAPR